MAIGELADGLRIDLDAVRKKYDGLDGTELAISESQERMAVVVAAGDADAFIRAAKAENLEAYQVAIVTEDARMVMEWNGAVIADLRRKKNENFVSRCVCFILQKIFLYSISLPECFLKEPKPVMIP